jgi:hypothetical protein
MALRTAKMRIRSPTHKLHLLHHAVRAAVVNPRHLHTSTTLTKEATSPSPTPLPTPHHHAENPSLPTLNLFRLLREARPAVRYTVYAGLGLMATVETTFWFYVLRAKFFPRASQQEQQKADALLERVNDAFNSYRCVWMANYGRYYGAYMWGLGYGGLDGIQGDDI